jgi:1,4-alpha-glucan branching enzyme
MVCRQNKKSAKPISGLGSNNLGEHFFSDGDPYLKPYQKAIGQRMINAAAIEKRLSGKNTAFADFASGHEYFGLHFRNGRWVFREWAPNAVAAYIVGDMTGWQEKEEFRLKPIGSHGVWGSRLGASKMMHGDLYRLRLYWENGSGDRLPAWARRVVQDSRTLIFNAQVWRPARCYQWQNDPFIRPQDPLLIYEAHVGMAQEAEKIGTYAEFTQNVLPRIADAGYNTIQLMAVAEHPYYASFGYQVSNFFAASSRFGTPEEFKDLIDTAHGLGLSVIMDLIHSHAVINEVEGLSRFDGTLHQYFHKGERGVHALWNSRCFDYGKPEVLHFLLSNCRFWLDEYKLDGFRFDGVTSMLYRHHGIGRSFTTYEDYFDDSVDEDAVIYLTLANRLIHELRPDALTIAEDMSGMPGLAADVSKGGMGFDCRFAMGIPDYWIRLTKDFADEDWPMGTLWHELTNRRADEKTVSYAESHDQALVGDQTLIFRLIGERMYDHMSADDDNPWVDRGMALHKMIRLITFASAGHGYLNFMGNEFGHPEWIDFPREGNGWSFKFAKRQWRLADDKSLKYHFLAKFDRDLLAAAKIHCFPEYPGPVLSMDNEEDKIIIFTRAALLFAFNFHPDRSFPDYQFEARPGKYEMILNTDARAYGGHGRIAQRQEHFTLYHENENGVSNRLSLYLPSRSGIVLQLL